MKSIMRIVLIASLLFLETGLFSQVNVDATDSNWINYSAISAESKRIYDHDVFQGDVYLFEEWSQAEFTLPNDATMVVDSVKLNLLRGHIEIYRDGIHLQLSNSSFNSFKFLAEPPSISYKSKHYYFQDGDRLKGIIKTEEVGDYAVLVSYKPDVRTVSKDNPFMISRLDKDKVRITKLRFIEKDGVVTRIKKKKDLTNFFSTNKSVKNFISKHKLSHKEEGDIAKVIAFAENMTDTP